jgi:hypothetical protein
MFGYEDSKWVEMVPDHMNVKGNEPDREARFIVRAVMKTIVGLSREPQEPPLHTGSTPQSTYWSFRARGYLV